MFTWENSTLSEDTLRVRGHQHKESKESLCIGVLQSYEDYTLQLHTIYSLSDYKMSNRSKQMNVLEAIFDHEHEIQEDVHED